MITYWFLEHADWFYCFSGYPNLLINEIWRFHYFSFGITKLSWNRHNSSSILKTIVSLTVCKSTIKIDHAQKVSSNHLFSNFFSKNVDLTEKSWLCFRPLFHFVSVKLQCAIWRNLLVVFTKNMESNFINQFHDFFFYLDYLDCFFCFFSETRM